MGLYARLYPKVLERIKGCSRFHGSFVRDVFIEEAQGKYFVDDHAEVLIRELVEEGLVTTLEKAPTLSQAAFAGLQYSNQSYWKQPWGSGTVEHYFYRWNQPLPTR